MKVTLIGDVVVDILVPVKSGKPPTFGQDLIASGAIKLVSGGSACNTAVQLSSLTKLLDIPFQITLYSSVSDNPNDHWRKVVEEKCASVGVILQNVTTSQDTGVCIVFTSPEDHGYITHRGGVGQLQASDLEPYLDEIAQTDHIHFSGLYTTTNLKPKLPYLIREIKRRNSSVTISLDPNLDSANIWTGKWVECLKDLDIIFPNETEALGISQKSSINDAMKFFTSQSKLGIITNGAKGVSCSSESFESFTVPAPKVEVVDKCGAGDAFCASFLFKWLQLPPTDKFKPSALKSVLEFAVQGGAKIVTVSGASSHLLTKDDFDAA